MTNNYCHSEAPPLSTRSCWTIPAIADFRVRQTPHKTFVRDASGQTETYATFWDRSRRLADGMRHLGVEPGDRVVIMARNGVPALHTWLGLGLIGAIDVPVNADYRGEPLSHVIATADPVVLVVETDLLPTLAGVNPSTTKLRHIVTIGELLEHPEATWLTTLGWHAYERLIAPSAAPDSTVPVLPTVQPADIASVIFTSGTTGPAKGVLMPHAQVCLLALQTIQAVDLGESDVFYCAHPLYHIAGKFMGVFATFAAGGTLFIERKFDPGVWLDRIRHCGATVSILHGPMIEMVQAQPVRDDDAEHYLSRLMCCPVPRGIGDAFRSRFQLKTIEMWGMSEVACPCWTSLQDTYIEGSCGKVLTEWYDLAIVDPETDEPLTTGSVGEIVVRPRHPWTIMQGYLGMPEVTTRSWRNLWFHTGDAAYADRDGNIFFLDRLGDRIRRRSENISSYDIETVAAQHDAVKECAAFGVPSEYDADDDVMLCIVPKDSAPVSLVDVFGHLARNLPHFMVPRFIEVIDELPRTPTNKVRKKLLRQKGITENTWDAKAHNVSVRDFL